MSPTYQAEGTFELTPGQSINSSQLAICRKSTHAEPDSHLTTTDQQHVWTTCSFLVNLIKLKQKNAQQRVISYPYLLQPHSQGVPSSFLKNGPWFLLVTWHRTENLNGFQICPQGDVVNCKNVDFVQMV